MRSVSLFVTTVPSDTSNGDVTVLRAARALAVALVVLPFLLLLPIDYDKLAPLALLPAIALGWRIRPFALSADRVDAGLLLVVATAALLSAAVGPHPAPSFVSLSSWAWILAAVVLARRCASSPRASRIVLIGVSSGAALGCVAVWLTWSVRSSGAVFPFYGHGRIFGLHMLVGTMTSLVLLQAAPNHRLEKFAIGVMAVLTFGGLLWAGGRAPMAGFGVGLVIWIWRSQRKDRTSIARYAGIAFILGLGLSLLQWSPDKQIGWWTAVERTAAATSVNELSSTRLDFWKTTWEAILDRPWLGHGADAYRFLTPKLDGDQPHNWVLQFLLDFGVFGAIAGGVWLVRQMARGLVRHSENWPDESLFLGAASTLAACLVTGLLDGVLYHAVILIPTALLAGLVGAPRFSTLGASRGQRSPTRTSFFALLLILSTLVLGLHSYLVYSLRYGPPPTTSRALSARILRRFPSTTVGINRWLESWKKENDQVALDWALWAQGHAAGPAPLHLFAAVIYADHGDFRSADTQMEAALRTAHWTSRPTLEHMRASIKAAAPAHGSLVK